MMVKPSFRALLITWFIRGAISPPLRVALRQWCRSHISQTTTAEFVGDQLSWR